MKSYRHFSYDKRVKLAQLKQTGSSVARMAKDLGRHRASIYRELSQNAAPPSDYWPDTAQRLTQKHRFRGCIIDQDDSLRTFILEKLMCHYWTPEQISGHLKHCQKKIPSQLIIALCDFANAQGCEKVLTYNQVRFEELIKERIGLEFERLSKEFYLREEMTKSTPKKSIIGFFDTSDPALERIYKKTGLKNSILHPGVIPAADLEETLKFLGYSLKKTAPR